jgi:hypothetical protein
VKRLIPFFILLLITVQPATAIIFEGASYAQDGVRVTAVVQAEVPWESPFTEAVNLTLTVTPLDENVINVTISTVSFTVHAEEPGEGYLLLASRTHNYAEPILGVSNATSSIMLEVSGSGTGEACYYGISVEGTFANSTGIFSYSTVSPENLVGPYVISLSVLSPQFLVGLGFIIFFLVITAVGVKVVRRIRKTPERRSLLDD